MRGVAAKTVHPDVIPSIQLELQEPEKGPDIVSTLLYEENHPSQYKEYSQS